MYLLIISFVAGVFLLHACSAFFLLSPVLAAALALGLSRWRMIAVLLLGYCWAGIAVSQQLQNQLARAVEGRDVRIQGCIEAIASGNAGRSRQIRFRVHRMDAGEGWHSFPVGVLLRWYEPVPDLRTGQCGELQVRMKRPHGHVNPGGFDYERWLFQQGIRATGYVRAVSGSLQPDAVRPGPVRRLRQRLQQYFSAATRDPSQALLQALTVGDRGAVSGAQWSVLNATGTTHLLAISGLHISLVAGLVFQLVRRTLVRSSRLTQHIPAVRIAAVMAIVAALAYADLSGFAIPARRAVLMVAVFMFALVLNRQAGLLHLLALVAALTLLYDPLSMLAAGWWLSFWAVLVIAWIVSGRSGRQAGVRRWLVLQAVLLIGMMPLMLLVFQRVSLVAPLANWVAVPVVGLLVVPVALLGVLAYALYEPAGVLLFAVAGRLLDWLWSWLQWLARSDLASWSTHAPVWWTLLPAIAGVALLLAPRGVPARWCGVILLLPMLLVKPLPPERGGFRLTLLDVGQGLSVVVETASHTLVYDTGPGFGEEFDTGRTVVVPFLQHQGISRLDMLMISHGDNDHIGGARSVLAAFPARTIQSSVPERLAGYHAALCRGGTEWEWDAVHFRILHPPAGNDGAGNNRSCVLRIETSSGGAALLTGDIERAAEQQLLHLPPPVLQAPVLVVPHHGSNTSSTAGFIRAVAPHYALVPDGYLNRYRFPAAAVAARYRNAGVDLLETARSGAIVVTFSASNPQPQVVSWRDRYAPYWRWRN